MSDKLQTAGLVPYYRKDGEVYIFMQMRGADAKRWPNTWGFFGGALEEGETPLMAVMREVQEELSIEIPEPEFFRHYEGETTESNIFLLEVDEAFPERVAVRDGKYGKFLALSTIESVELRDYYRRIMPDLAAHFA
ncbi:MAG TPA: NUDIX domain-containing protein [Candidatus Paceibacterota bacterium]|nr:NUDIX domain-containing protein [Candidatus Paceibacterota bacterium]